MRLRETLRNRSDWDERLLIKQIDGEVVEKCHTLNVKAGGGQVDHVSILALTTICDRRAKIAWCI